LQFDLSRIYYLWLTGAGITRGSSAIHGGVYFIQEFVKEVASSIFFTASIANLSIRYGELLLASVAQATRNVHLFLAILTLRCHILTFPPTPTQYNPRCIMQADYSIRQVN
jgi:hypothetical protein